MPLRGGWYIPQLVNITQFTGKVSDQEFIQGANHPDIIPTLEASPYPLVHFIFHWVETPGLVNEPPGLRVASQIPLARHPKVGWLLLVNLSNNPVHKMVTSILAQMTRLRYREMASLDQTRAFLSEIDANIHAFPPFERIEWFNVVNWPQDAPNTFA